MLVHDFLLESAERSPQKTALVCGRERLTYRDLEIRSASLARALRARGLERGDRVLIWQENSVQAIVAIFGVLRAAGVFVVIDPAVKARKLAFLLADSEARALIAPEVKIRELEEKEGDKVGVPIRIATGPDGTTPGHAHGILTWDEVLQQDSAIPLPPSPCIDIDLAALIYTSGSTGQPKGVMLSHRNILSAAASISQYLGIQSDEVILDLLPLSFDYGLYQVFLAFRAGATLVLERGLLYPNVFLNLIGEERVTALPLVPTILAILLQIDLAKYNLASLRIVTNTGAALMPAQIRELRQRLPWVRIFSMYGLTECKRVSYLPPEEIDRRPASVGRAMPNSETYIVDEEGHRVGAGVEGELVVRGANVMLGYWRRPEETNRVLRQGPLPGERVLYTGDLFVADEDGFLYFRGRRDDVFKSRGERVSPREIELAISEHPGVAEVAVVAIPDPLLGNAIRAFILPKSGLTVTERELLRFCSENLETRLVPTSIEIRASFPRTSTGKIDRSRLAQEDSVQAPGDE